MYYYLYSYVVHSSAIGKLIFIAMIYFSIISVATYFTQSKRLNITIKETESFIASLKQAQSASVLFEIIAKNKSPAPPSVFLFKELFLFKKQERLSSEERGRLENHLDYLSLEVHSVVNKYSVLLPFIASIAPFLGLVGTIFGIINTFHGITISGNASIAAIAPGMAESLMSTATSIFVAIIASSIHTFLSEKREQAYNKLNALAILLIDKIISDGDAPQNERSRGLTATNQKTQDEETDGDSDNSDDLDQDL